MQECKNLPRKRDIEIILNKIKHSKLFVLEKTLKNNVSWEQYKLQNLTQGKLSIEKPLEQIQQRN